MYILCPECKQHYDDTETQPKGEAQEHRHYGIGVRPVDERIAARANAEHTVKRAQRTG